MYTDTKAKSTRADNTEAWARLQECVRALTADEIASIDPPSIEPGTETPAEFHRRKRGERLAARLEEFGPELEPVIFKLLAPHIATLLARLQAEQGVPRGQ